jgi:beta-glucosidase
MRVKDLMSIMTLDEKVGQMTQGGFNAVSASKNDITNYFLGSVLNGGSEDPSNITPKGWADAYDNLQSYALKTRLNIPLIWGIDAVHGHNNVSGAVIFPHNIGLGCTRNPALVEQAGKVTATEIAGTGIDWTFAPCIAVPQDERWGRTYEGFGETAELAKMFAPAIIKGLQGSKLSDSVSVVACAKHFVAEGGTANGTNQGNAQIDTATLRAIHLPGYIEAIKENVGTIMASYNSWNGVKCHGSKYLLTDLLKNELGFKGFVISDWDAIDQLPGNYSSDIETSINAGIDMVMVPSKYKEFFTTLKTLVVSGKVPMSRIDDAVSRILTIKFQLGLFENPFTNRSMTSLIGSSAHREVARECVRQSLVVLKRKDGILPLAKTGIKIHVSGKNADNLQNQCGGWTLGWQDFEGKTTKGTTILKAIRNKASVSNVSYSADGTNATAANITVAVIGENSYAEGGGDKSDLSVDRGDIEVVRRLKATGKPVIVIIVSGRPLIVSSILPYCDALIAAWLPGTEGDGVADVLFGDFQPVGLLGHSWPENMEQIPINQGDTDYNPLFAYGHGLTSLNDTPAGTAPEIYSAATSESGDTIEISFSKYMSALSLNSENFTVKVNKVITQVNGAFLKKSDKGVIQLALAKPVKADDVITFSYLPGSLTSQDNGKLEAVVDKQVYNVLNELKLLTKIPGRIQAENYIAMNGVQTENTTDIGGGQNVGYIETGDWMDYLVNVAETGEYTVECRVASQSYTGKITLQLNGQTISNLASLTVNPTGGWQKWTTVNTTVKLNAGKHTIRVYFTAGGININWLNFIKITTGVKNIENQNLKIYPNPAGKELYIESNEFQYDKIEIFDINGRLVQAENVSFEPKKHLKFTLPMGVYCLKISNRKKFYTHNFIIN